MEQKNNLMTMASEANALEQLIFESGGELNETLETWMAEISTGITTKADAYYFMMQKLEATAEMFSYRASQNANAAKSLTNAVSSMKERIKAAMMIMGTDEVKGSEIRFKLQNSTPRLVVENESVLPAKFFVTETITTLDKKSVTTAIKAGEVVDGARLEETKSLRNYINKGTDK